MFRFSVSVALMVGVVFLASCSKSNPPDAVMVFDGDSAALKATQIVPTLDTPMEAGKNVIWCGSFVAAWKTLEDDVIKGPVKLVGDPPAATRLNDAPDVRKAIPVENLYAAAGWAKDGIVKKIQEGMKAKFPDAPKPEFPDVTGEGVEALVAYAYMEANLKFKKPYLENPKSLTFTDSSGKRTRLNSFGLPHDAEDRYRDLRKQAAVLYQEVDEKTYAMNGCAIDLDRDSKTHQIIIALVEPKATLGETLAAVEAKIAAAAKNSKPKSLDDSQILLIPNMFWKISHHFKELEDKVLANPDLTDYFISTAQQDIQFKLNRSGAELKSEAKIFEKWAQSSSPYIFNRPFLIYMKQRGTAEPYFAMWMDNAELLTPWE